ncbi:MAG: acetate--CoA ligase family protein, partial [Erysipelotrichaceae bacterium]|nr:acetate--CoA ligase family protein [Erysipelotrichaceae bacterium]
MNIHEYQARELFMQYGIPVSVGKMAETARQAAEIAGRINPPYILKAQIHSGGRGKAGGVKVVRELKDVEKQASELFGRILVTGQTGPQGKKVRKILVAEAAHINEEYYVAVSVDRSAGQIVLLGCRDGGVEIEEIARSAPEKIVKTGFSLKTGLKDYHIRYFLDQMKLPYSKELAGIIAGMVRLFIEKDCSLVEINPLALTSEGYMAVDAKI